MHRPSRLSILPILLLAGIPVLAQAPAPRAASGPAEAALKDLRARAAPDSRLVVFDVTAEQAGDGLLLRGEVETPAARDAALEAVRRATGRAVTDRIVVLPDPSLGAEIAAVVRVSVANVKGTPGHAAELVTQSLMGWPVRIIKRQSGWNLVHTEPDGYLGWIEDLQIERMTAADRDGWLASPRMVVTAAHTIARATPDENGEPVTDLVVAGVAKSVGSSGAWQHVELPDGRRAFVRAQDVMEVEAWKGARLTTPEAIGRTAARFMGVPYLWGGTSAKGFDCSGFAKTVFHLHGIDLPRDTDQQARMGVAVAIDAALTQLRTGDLLFFGTAATADRRERVTHVGVHVGRSEFIHASGLVRRSSLDPASPLYDDGLRKRLLRVRRVLPDAQTTGR